MASFCCLHCQTLTDLRHGNDCQWLVGGISNFFFWSPIIDTDLQCCNFVCKNAIETLTISVTCFQMSLYWIKFGSDPSWLLILPACLWSKKCHLIVLHQFSLTWLNISLIKIFCQIFVDIVLGFFLCSWWWLCWLMLFNDDWCCVCVCVKWTFRATLGEVIFGQ